MKQIIVICCLFPVFFLSCAARIDGALAADGSASLTVSMSIMPRMAAMIRAFSAAGGGQADSPVLDAPSIQRSMSGAPGIASVTLRNTTAATIEGNVRISQINEFLSAAAGTNFITIEQTGRNGRCEININSANGNVILESLSPQIADYLNSLMAPIVTGEELSKDYYLDLITTFYNKAISDEIADSKIRASIEFPGNITSVRGGTFAGRRANFEIPLIDILVLERPLVYEVRWN